MNVPGLNHPAWTPLIVASALLALTFWLGRLAQAPTGGDESGFEHEPDYVVESFQSTVFDTEGHPRYRLSADKMTHYMDDDSTTLERPRFSRDIPGRPRLDGQSARGLISADGENIYLLEAVQLRQAASGEQAPYTLTTEYLRIVPDADLIRTDKPVTLRQNRSVVTASGMVADGRKRTLQLRGRVNGTYENQH